MRSFAFFAGLSFLTLLGSMKKCWQCIQRQPVTSFLSGVTILAALHLAQYLSAVNRLTHVPVGSSQRSQGCWRKINANRSEENHSNRAAMFRSVTGSSAAMRGARLFWDHRTSANGDVANRNAMAGSHHFFRSSARAVMGLSLRSN